MAHSLLRAHVDMGTPRNDEDLICSCRHPACTITSLWHRASADLAAGSAVPEPLPFDLSDTTVTDLARDQVLSPPPGVPVSYHPRRWRRSISTGSPGEPAA